MKGQGGYAESSQCQGVWEAPVSVTLLPLLCAGVNKNSCQIYIHLQRQVISNGEAEDGGNGTHQGGGENCDYALCFCVFHAYSDFH